VFHIYDAIDAALLKKHESEDLTITVWLIKLFGEAMMRHEELRTTLSPGGLQVWPGASISVAMAHGEALYMPVFKEIQNKSVDAIAEELADLKSRVRSGRLEPGLLKGSTFGLRNLGMSGIERFDAMINGSDCGIAAIGAEREGCIAVTLTLDHRIVNGWQGAEFMQTLKSLASDVNFFKTAKEE
jgi:pyruvate dehydrogenase E2 component (dihydrolipoamide acetyltransferase)